MSQLNRTQWTATYEDSVSGTFLENTTQAIEAEDLRQLSEDISDSFAMLTDVIGKQDIWVGASSMWPRATNGCAALARTEMATSLVNLQTLDFDQTTQEFAQFCVQLPRNYNNGTITFLVHWTASAGSGGVVWSLQGGAYSNDDALTTALGTAVTVSDTLITANDNHITSRSTAVTIAGTPADLDLLYFQISRVTGDGSDTLTADAKLIGISIELTTDAAIAG